MTEPRTQPGATPTEPQTELLRAEFLRLLTQDSETHDQRRRDYNQAIFDAKEGWAIWSGTDLNMIMDKFDRAVRSIGDNR